MYNPYRDSLLHRGYNEDQKQLSLSNQETENQSI